MPTRQTEPTQSAKAHIAFGGTQAAFSTQFLTSRLEDANSAPPSTLDPTELKSLAFLDAVHAIGCNELTLEQVLTREPTEGPTASKPKWRSPRRTPI